MDLIRLTLDEHIKLLNQLGYEVDGTAEEIPEFSSVNIYKKDKVVGSISYEEKNMFYLFRDKRIVGNRDISKLTFNKRKIKNMRSVIHVKLHDHNLKFNGYNQLISTNDNVEKRDYITITDNQTYRITKYLNQDEIEVKSLDDSIPDDEILNSLRKPNKSLTYSLKEVK